MSNEEKLENLKYEHKKLDKQIQLLEKNYGYQNDITYLKKKKLKLKDTMKTLEGAHNGN